MSSQGPGACLIYCWMQMELRDLQSQTKVHERRRPSDMMELVRLEGRSYQVLYATAGATYTLHMLNGLATLYEVLCAYSPSRKGYRKHRM